MECPARRTCARDTAYGKREHISLHSKQTCCQHSGNLLQHRQLTLVPTAIRRGTCRQQMQISLTEYQFGPRIIDWLER